MTTKRILSIALFLIVFANVTAFAQRNTSLISSKNYVGIEAGLNYSWLMGGEKFFWVYDYPSDPGFNYIGVLSFNNLGGGIGYHIAGTLDLSFTDFLGLQAKVFYRAQMTGTTESISDTCSSGIGIPPGNATFENNYQFNVSHIGLSAALRLQFVPETWYGLVGLEYASTMSATLSGYANITASDNSCQWHVWPSGTPIGTDLPIAEGDIKSSLNSSRIGLNLGIGTFIPIGSNGWVLTPELNVGIPVTPLFSTSVENAYKNGVLIGDPVNFPGSLKATTPNLWHASLSIALKFPFGGSSIEEPMETSVADGPDHGEKFAQLKGKVTNAKTGEPVKADITVTDLNSSKIVAKSSTDDDGLYDIRVKAPGRYSVTADASGYLFGSAYFQTDADGRILKGDHDIKLSSANDGRTRLLVFFDFNKDNLQPESFPELERAVTIMKSHPSMEVEIAGYTDNVGSDAYNNDLSKRRANSVKEYLVRHDIPANRIQAKGYGKDNPILPNDTDEGRAANRRVEFVVLKK